MPKTAVYRSRFIVGSVGARIEYLNDVDMQWGMNYRSTLEQVYVMQLCIWCDVCDLTAG
jgi:two-component SAPR family response regulator